jgi:hypothetical protein
MTVWTSSSVPSTCHSVALSDGCSSATASISISGSRGVMSSRTGISNCCGVELVPKQAIKNSWQPSGRRPKQVKTRTGPKVRTYLRASLACSQAKHTSQPHLHRLLIRTLPTALKPRFDFAHLNLVRGGPVIANFGRRALAKSNGDPIQTLATRNQARLQSDPPA